MAGASDKIGILLPQLSEAYTEMKTLETKVKISSKNSEKIASANEDKIHLAVQVNSIQKIESRDKELDDELKTLYPDNDEQAIKNAKSGMPTSDPCSAKTRQLQIDLATQDAKKKACRTLVRKKQDQSQKYLTDLDNIKKDIAEKQAEYDQILDLKKKIDISTNQDQLAANQAHVESQMLEQKLIIQKRQEKELYNGIIKEISANRARKYERWDSLVKSPLAILLNLKDKSQLIDWANDQAALIKTKNEIDERTKIDFNHYTKAKTKYTDILEKINIASAAEVASQGNPMDELVSNPNSSMEKTSLIRTTMRPINC